MRVYGKVVKFGDSVNTDAILPGKYLVYIDPKELAKHAMEGLDPDFPKKAAGGVVIVAGKNFGCGSSREQAPLALKYSNVKCVVADSFARIFFRNAINIGLPVLECSGVSFEISEGDLVEVDLKEGSVKVPGRDVSLQATRLPSFILDILKDGGLVEHIRKVGHR